MPDPAALLARIDRIMAELMALRAEVATSQSFNAGISGITPASESNGFDRDEELIEISTAVARFNRPADSLRWLCRHAGVGEKRGNRWLVSPVRLRARLGQRE